MLEVVCALIQRDGRLLLARRADNGLWELPGGKIEPGESPADALAREIVEELGTEVAVGTPCGQAYEKRPGYLLRLRAFRCRFTGGEPQALEHRQLAWVSPAELPAYQMAPADRAILSDAGAAQ